MKKFRFIALLALSVSSVYSTVINIPYDQTTIQAGIDAPSEQEER